MNNTINYDIATFLIFIFRRSTDNIFFKKGDTINLPFLVINNLCEISLFSLSYGVIINGLVFAIAITSSSVNGRQNNDNLESS